MSDTVNVMVVCRNGFKSEQHYPCVCFEVFEIKIVQFQLNCFTTPLHQWMCPRLVSCTEPILISLKNVGVSVLCLIALL